MVQRKRFEWLTCSVSVQVGDKLRNNLRWFCKLPHPTRVLSCQNLEKLCLRLFSPKSSKIVH